LSRGHGRKSELLELVDRAPRDELPTFTTKGASFTSGTVITHSQCPPIKAWKLKSLLLTTQAIKGGSKSTIMCHDIVMTLGLPPFAVVSNVTGPGSTSL
jgi:hypothetical protein